MFAKFLKVADTCPHCGEELHHHRADDAPPYFTIFIVGHIVIPLVLVTEKLWHPNLFVHASLWLIVTLAAHGVSDAAGQGRSRGDAVGA